MNLAFTLLIVSAGFFAGIACGLMMRKIVRPYRGRGRLMGLRHDGLPQGGVER